MTIPVIDTFNENKTRDYRIAPKSNNIDTIRFLNMRSPIAAKPPTSQFSMRRGL